MCGIAGVIGDPSQDVLEKMLVATRHRGPDDNGIFIDKNASIGMNRLAIQDVSSAGHQPMISVDERFVIIFNGEVYNFKEERALLEKQGIEFNSSTDTEVVLKLYVHYGKDSLKRLRGMFAFAIWDRKQQSMFAARDHLGIKPFLYSVADKGLIFCSELKGLLASDRISRKINQAAMAEYFLSGYINQPKTIIEGVQALLPGHSLEWKNGKVKTERYWSILDNPPTVLPSYQEAVEEIRALTIASIKEEMISDVPLGVFLSGGLDSSVVVAAMKAAGASKIESFSIGFGGEANEIDETNEARLAAKYYGTNHNQISISSKEAANEFSSMVHSFDQPTLDAYNTYFVSKYAKNKVTVALSGLGGDEFFGGYGFHRRHMNDSQKRKPQVYYKLLEQGAKLLQSRGRLYQSLINRSLDRSIAGQYSKVHQNLTPHDYKQLIRNNKLSKMDLTKSILDEAIRLDAPAIKDVFQRISLIDFQSWMGNCLLRDSDSVSMQNSLELRVPLIDIRLAHYVFHLPWHFKFDKKNLHKTRVVTYASGQIKRLLSDAFKEELPSSLFENTKKGFSMPVKTWLESEYFREKVDSIFLDNMNPIFCSSYLRKIYCDWKEKGVGYKKIWGILVFEEWCRINKLH